MLPILSAQMLWSLLVKETLILLPFNVNKFTLPTPFIALSLEGTRQNYPQKSRCCTNGIIIEYYSHLQQKKIDQYIYL